MRYSRQNVRQFKTMRMYASNENQKESKNTQLAEFMFPATAINHWYRFFIKSRDMGTCHRCRGMCVAQYPAPARPWTIAQVYRLQARGIIGIIYRRKTARPCQTIVWPGIQPRPPRPCGTMALPLAAQLHICWRTRSLTHSQVACKIGYNYINLTGLSMFTVNTPSTALKYCTASGIIFPSGTRKAMPLMLSYW